MTLWSRIGSSSTRRTSSHAFTLRQGLVPGLVALALAGTVLQRALKLRLYPTPAQDAELREWERQLRWLYNLAHEQRLAALARPAGERPGQRRKELRARAQVHAGL